MGTRSISKDSATYLPNAEDRRQLIDIKEALTSLSEDSQRTVDRRLDDLASQQDFPVAMLKVPGNLTVPLPRNLRTSC